MKKLILLLPSFFLFSTFQLSAQESIGYSDSTDFQNLIDYRLPDWGYSNFYISSAGLNANGSYLSNDEQRVSNPAIRRQLDQSRNSLGLGITPRFELYRESEKRVFSLNLLSNFSSSFSRNTSDFDGPLSGRDEETSSRFNRQTLQYSIDLENNLYVSDNLFLISDLFSNITYNRRFTKAFDLFTRNEDIIRTRTITISPSVGIGIGRIRNVTPVIRAIRVNERYKELGNQTFTRNEIRNTADTFTKVQGYQRTRDRFLKDFWGDVNTGVNGKLDQVGTFDLFYLNDVFSENLGSRFEGYEAFLTVDYVYSNDLFKENDKVNNIDNRTLSINRAANLNLNFDWFKNLNLYHQISLNAENSFLFPLERRNSEEWISQTSLVAQWLWNFADRFQLTTDFTNRYITREPKRDPDDEFNNFASQLQTNLFYFIESKIALTAGVGLNYRSINDDSRSFTVTNNQFQWTLNAGISYYFNRNLY